MWHGNWKAYSSLPLPVHGKSLYIINWFYFLHKNMEAPFSMKNSSSIPYKKMESYDPTETFFQSCCNTLKALRVPMPYHWRTFLLHACYVMNPSVTSLADLIFPWTRESRIVSHVFLIVSNRIMCTKIIYSNVSGNMYLPVPRYISVLMLYHCR